MSAKPWLPRTSRPWFLREQRAGLRVLVMFAWRQSALEPDGTVCETCRGPVAIHGFELPDAEAYAYWMSGRWPYLTGAGMNRDDVTWACFPRWEIGAVWLRAGGPKAPWPGERRNLA